MSGRTSISPPIPTACSTVLTKGHSGDVYSDQDATRSESDYNSKSADEEKPKDLAIDEYIPATTAPKPAPPAGTFQWGRRSILVDRVKTGGERQMDKDDRKRVR